MADLGAPNPIDVHVGARLRARRVQLRISQGELATALDVTFQQIQKYERGANRISASKLFEATQFLRLSVSALFEGLGSAGAVDDTIITWPDGKAALRIAQALPHLPAAIANRFADLMTLVAEGANDNQEDGGRSA